MGRLPIEEGSEAASAESQRRMQRDSGHIALKPGISSAERIGLMRYRWLLAVGMAGFLFGVPAGAQTLQDVPEKHWARKAVQRVVERGVMSAPDGKFNGGRAVTRAELVLVLANLGRALEQKRWNGGEAAPLKSKPPQGEWRNRPITRYELAALVDRMAAFIANGLPAPQGKTFGKSEALPPAATIRSVPRTSPLYEPLSYLVKNRMVWPKSVLLEPGSQPVTGEQVSTAFTQFVAGLTDRLTDEPQNREEISPPPRRRL